MGSKKCCDAVVKKVEHYDKLGLTHEYLFAEYIVKNKSLQALADEKNVKIGVIRNALTTHNIVKSAVAITRNRAEAVRKSAKDPNRRRASLEDSRRAQRLGTEARNANRTKELAKQGITHEYLYNLYIEENKSLKELMAILDRPKSTVRKLLKRFNITKTQELRDKTSKRESYSALRRH